MGIHGARWLSWKGCPFSMAHSPNCGPDHMSLGTLGQAMAMFSVSSCFQLEMMNMPWNGGVGDESTRLQISWTTRDLVLAGYTDRTHTSNRVSHGPACMEVRFLLYHSRDLSPTDSKRRTCLQKPSPGPFPREASLLRARKPALMRPGVEACLCFTAPFPSSTAETVSACFWL